VGDYGEVGVVVDGAGLEDCPAAVDLQAVDVYDPTTVAVRSKALLSLTMRVNSV